MSIESSLDLKPLSVKYLLANTPMYLYSRFREEMTIQNLCHQFDLTALAEEFNRRVGREPRCIQDVVVAYGIVIGLTFLEANLTNASFGRMDLSKLDWGTALRDIFHQSHIPTITSTVASGGVASVSISRGLG